MKVYMQELSALEGKTIHELREIARVLGITPSTMKKGELLDKIIEVATSAAPDESAAQAPQAPKRGRRPRMGGIKVEGNAPRQEVVPAEPEVVTTIEEEPTPTVEEAPAAPKRRGRKPKMQQPAPSCLW